MDTNDFKTVVEQDRMELMLRFPFYGRVICQCEMVPVRSTDAPVACNDCRHIYLAKQAYLALLPEERLLVLAHEVLHITLRHAFRCGNRDEERFSFATYAEIHPLLRDEFPQAVMRGYKTAWDGLTAEEIYELLPKKLPAPPPMHCYPSNPPNTPPSEDHGGGDMENMASQGGDDAPDDDSGNASAAGGDGDDTGSEKTDGCDGGAQDQSEGEEQGQGGCQGQDQGKNAIGGQGRGEGSDKEDSQGGNVGEGSNGAENGNPHDDGDGDNGESHGKARTPAFDADAEMFCRNLSADAEIELKTRGGRGDGAGNHLLRLLEKINVPHVDWKILLRQFIREVRGGSYRWLPPNRRFISKGLYLPGRRQKMFRGVVALDTSGSTVKELPGFVEEVEQLMRSFGKFELNVIECDAAVGNVTVVSSGIKPHDWRKHRFSGGGGTDFTPVFKYINEKRLNPNVLVFFTDGNGACPGANPSYPVLWLLTRDGQPPVSWGVPIKMKG
ncbi:MAG: hypothetical protein J6Y54_00235 [Lentisphaeria bacterium]|nr:hypothetical protein [Lentisphaeria bacterium]